MFCLRHNRIINFSAGLFGSAVHPQSAIFYQASVIAAIIFLSFTVSYVPTNDLVVVILTVLKVSFRIFSCKFWDR